MTATCSRLTVIQIFISFIIGEASSKYGINTTMIEGITQDNLLMGLILDTMTIYTRKVKPESLDLEIDDNISIPYFIRTDQKEGFIK
jgi:hypothetical protein